MTKSGKHKKEFRKEKNKIKLKLSAQSKAIIKGGKGKKGKKGGLLPKGLNVTDTSFKTKKIVLPDNLRPDESENIPLTRKKQTFKELLSHMSHYNSTLQLDGINGMKELVTKHPDILEVNLSQLIGKLAELSVSIESVVRKSGLKLMEFIVSLATEDKVAPFFPLLNAQLLCAMNHIQVDIQQDSHFFLDLLLSKVPKLVAPVTMRILPNFLEQISSRGEGGTNGKRVLAINPTQRLTSLKWRQEVLTRVCKLLELVPNVKNEIASPSIYSVDGMNGNHLLCPLYSSRNFHLKLNVPLPGRVACKVTGGKSNELCEFTSHLFPLLIETWVEAMAGEQLSKATQGGSLIGSDTAALLSCICNVIVILWTIFERAENGADMLLWFEKEFGDQFIRHLVQRLPFSCRSDNRKSASKIDTECRQQNLIISFMWAQMGNLKSSTKHAPTVFQYISHLLNTADQNPLSNAETGQIKETLKITSVKKNYQSQVDQVIETAVRFIRRVRPDRKDRLALSRALIDVGLDVEDLDRIPSLKKWIETSPQLLKEQGSLSLLPSINRAMSRNWNVLTCGRQQVVSLLQMPVDCQSPEWKLMLDFAYWTCCDWSEKEKIVQILQSKSDDHYTRGMVGILGAV